jgi:hypothetical protein
MLAVREQAAPDCRSREEPGGWITEAAPRGEEMQSPGVLLRQSGRAADAGLPGCRGLWPALLGTPGWFLHTPEKHAQGEISRVEDGDSDGNRFRYRLRGSRQLDMAASPCGMGSSVIQPNAITAVPFRLEARANVGLYTTQHQNMQQDMI